MSIVIIQDNSGGLLSAGNDNISVISGNTLGAPNVFEYKYICDVVVNGVIQVTLKSFPDPVYGVGVFNTKNIIDSFLGFDYIGALSGDVFNQCPSSSCRVRLQYGEEYMSGSTFVQNRDVNDGGESIYINSSIPVAANIDNGGISGMYLPDGNNVSYLDSRLLEANIDFATAMQFPQFAQQNRYLYFVNNTRLGSNANIGFHLNIITFDGDDNEMGSYTIDTPYDFTTATDVQAININQSVLGSASYTVNSGPGTMFGNGEIYYVAYLTGDGVGNCAWNFVQLNITESCDRFANTVYYIDWLNEAGGFSSWLFDKKNETTQTKQVQKYKKITGQLVAGGEFIYNTFDRSQQQYFTVTQNSIVMNTNFLSDNDVLYLKSLVSSPLVYIRSNELNGLTVAASVQDNSYKISKRVNQKIYSLQITVDLSLNDYRQQF